MDASPQVVVSADGQSVTVALQRRVPLTLLGLLVPDRSIVVPQRPRPTHRSGSEIRVIDRERAGNTGVVETTLDIEDSLFRRAEAEAQRRDGSLAALVAEGLAMALNAPTCSGYKLPDLSVGEPDGENPLERLTPGELGREIYGNRIG